MSQDDTRYVRAPGGGYHSVGGEEETEAAPVNKRKLWAAGIFASLAFLLLLRSSCRESEKPGGIVQTADQTSCVAEVVGRYLAHECPGARILLITEPQWSADYRPPLVKATIKGLKKGFGTTCSLEAVAAPELPRDLFRQSLEAAGGKAATREGGMWTPSVAYWFTAQVLDAVLAKNSMCTVAVSMVGLPGDFADCCLGEGSIVPGTKLVVLDGGVPSAGTVKPAFEKGILLGAVVNQPADHDEASPAWLPPRLGGKFVPRHVLLTPESIDHYVEKHPDFFGR